MINLIEVKNLKIGYSIIENDGYILTVSEILKETEKTIKVRLINNDSIDKTLWSENGGIIKTFRKSTKIYINSSNDINLDILRDSKEISIRTYNTLKRAGFNDLFSILKTSADEIQNIYNMSKLSLKEIRKCCFKYFNESPVFSI